MNKRRVLVISVVLVVLLLLAIWWYTGRDSVETVEVRRGAIDVTIQTVATIEVGSQILSRSSTSGTVGKVGAEPGDRVDQGDILVLLDVEALEEQLEAAKRQLEEAEFALQAAERQLDSDPTDENRFAALRAENDRQQAIDAVEQAEADIEASAITAPEDGIVAEIVVQRGDSVTPSQIVARMFSDEELILIANVDELDLPNVEQGADARFRLDAYPEMELPGEVMRTSPDAEQQGGATVFATEIEILDQGELDIRPGMNADVTIVTEQRDDALLVPEQAIRTVGERSFVSVLEDGETEEREVILGHRAGGEAEVVSG
ncbi:MAG: efflux RND transporter periplasmic adaptor subunit, partial [Chloroflexota bacterium]